MLIIDLPIKLCDSVGLLEWYDGRIIAKETISFTNRSRYATIEHNYGKEYEIKAQTGWPC